MDNGTLLDSLLPEETLNNLIRSCTSLESLNTLLQVKRRRAKQGSCERINISINCIYGSNSVTDVDSATRILKTALQVAQNYDKHVVQAVNYCLDNIHASNINVDEVYYCLNLFNVVLEFYVNENRKLTLSANDFDRFQNGITRILNGSSKPVITFILVYIIPNFLNSTKDENACKFLSQIFDKSVKKEKKLEIVCVCYGNFIKPELNEKDFNVIKSDEFWLLIMDCLTQQHHYVKRQAIYLLSRTMDIVLKLHNAPSLPKFLTANEKSWRNYLLLLDVSNEKQLHIVEPSLSVLSSVLNLDFLWRVCLYKILLNHSQNVIVYNTASFILENETNWENFSKMITEVLSAVNKNEYNSYSVRVFKKFGTFCNKLENNQFEFLLSQSLNVAWVPAAVWSFYNNIFNPKNGSFQISIKLLDSVIKNLKLVPHKCIRNGCTNILINYFTKNYCADSIHNLLKVSSMIRKCNEILFENFIRLNSDQIRPFLEGDCQNLQDSDTLYEIMQLLNVEVPQQMIRISKNCNLVESDELLNRIDNIENGREVAPLLCSYQGNCSEKLLDKASDILGKYSDKYNKAQKFIAFEILNRNDRRACSFVDFWHKFLKFDNSDEHITQLFVDNFMKYLDEKEIEESLIILEHVLDAQSQATITVLESLTNILKDIDVAIPFIERCCDEFLKLVQTNAVRKSTSEKFLSQIFQPDLLENDAFAERLVGFSQRLLAVANNTNSIACILSDNVARVVQRNSKNGAIFIPVIVDLILYGIIVNKSERVEYHICQEIRRVLPHEHNPNLDQMLTRLLALDSMVVLVENVSSNHTDSFISLLLEKYKRYFSKRYFPDSQIHLEKLRILQALILLIKHTNSENSSLVELIIESFIVETHQPSVKLLLQFLLILLIRRDSKNVIRTICEKLKTIDNNRPSTVTGLIPVLSHLIASQNETEWDQLVEILLPYTMGAQFKLRIYAQVALDKIYKKAINMNYVRFLEKYEYLYKSLADIIEATGEANFDVSNIYNEFFDFSVENCDCSTILYTIPKNHGVTQIEWENVCTITNNNRFRFIKFNHADDNTCDISMDTIPKNVQSIPNEHIQKKITPWKEMLNLETNNCASDFILITTLIEKPANLGGLSRTCEVFGIKRVVMRTSKITSDKEFRSLSMSSENWIDVTEVKVENLQKFILDIKKQGYCVLGAEQTSDSVKLDQFQFPEKTVLLLGNEKKGIPADLIPLLDQCVEIPQFGMVRSLNVHVAGAIVMWEYCKQQKL